MSAVDKQNESIFKKLPQQKLSFAADRKIKRQLSDRAYTLGYKTSPWVFLQRLVAVPVAMTVLLMSFVGYGYSSSSVVLGDRLFTAKLMIEEALYPEKGSAEERVAFHLWLSDRRYAEVFEILKRRSLDGSSVSFIPMAVAASPPPTPLKGEPGVASRLTVNTTLDKVLRLTLQAAYRNTEAAVEISTEIVEVKKAKLVHETIRRTVVRHRVLIEEIAPALEAIVLEADADFAEEADVVEDTMLTAERDLLELGVSETAAIPELHRQPVLVKRQTLRDLLEKETSRQEVLLEKMVLTVERAVSEGAEEVSTLQLIPVEKKLLAPVRSSLSDVGSEDRFERIMEEASDAHKEATRKLKIRYEKVLDSKTQQKKESEELLDERRRLEQDEENLNPDLIDSKIHLMDKKEEIEVVPTPVPSTTIQPYEKKIPVEPVGRDVDLEKERDLLEKDKASYIQPVPPSTIPPGTADKNLNNNYEVPLNGSADNDRVVDWEVEKERSLLER